ncbi:MAG: YlbF family regulator, partial [Lachnospiraceae bacterium]|nr:YlbF family regulator [Lachnospiraceae bacterium]
MNNVKKAANQMIDAIKASDIYQEYEKQLAVVKAQPELKHQIDEF